MRTGGAEGLRVARRWVLRLQDYAYTPRIWPSLFTVLLWIGMSVYGWRRRTVPGALPFAIGVLFAAAWGIGAIMEYAAVDVDTKIFWFKFQSVWQLPAVTATTCFVLEYAWPGRWLTRRNLVLLSIAPLLFAMIILTDDIHHLAWRGFSYSELIVPHRGPANWAFVAYGYGLSLINVIALVWLLIHAPQNRWALVLMLTGQIASRALYALQAAHTLHYPLRLDLLALAVPSLIYAVALFGFGIFQPIPMARRAVIAQMRDGMLVLDAVGRVASLNPAAQEILGVQRKNALHRTIQDLLPKHAHGSGDLDIGKTGQTEIRFGSGSETRYYLLETSDLKDWRGPAVGHLLLLRDVTAQRQAHLQIVGQQRALAMLHEREQLSRELHDNLGQVFAFISIQGQAIRHLLSRGEVSTADEYVSRLIDVAREADIDIRESILGLRVALSEQGLFPALASYVAQYERLYGIRTELTKPESGLSGAFEPLVEVQLLRILQEALTNVRKHADARRVRIAFATDDGWIRVTVQDDGDGFDPTAAFEESDEHVGLSVMRERVEEVGGTFSLKSALGQGTEVVVRVPMSAKDHRRREGDG
ncbi:MAG: histidine kinase N-terminal 7TM domain-containing protein [Anaerolineae bacterium]